MKRIAWSLVICLAGALRCAAQTGNHIEAVAGYQNSVAPNASLCRGFKVGAAYSWDIGANFVALPEATLRYAVFGDADCYNPATLLSLGANFGYCISPTVAKVTAFTGPALDIKLYQHEIADLTYSPTIPGITVGGVIPSTTAPLVLRWTAGLRMTFDRITLSAAYSFGLTDDHITRGNRAYDYADVTVGYRF